MIARLIIGKRSRAVTLMLAMGAVAASGFTGGAWAQQPETGEPAAKPRPAFPNETVCPTPLAANAPGPWSDAEKAHKPWSAHEQWAWDQRICLGNRADLSKRPEGESTDCDVWLAPIDWSKLIVSS